MEILTVKDLTFTYPRHSSPTLENVSFSAYAGEFIVVCGRTGGGKSTLLKHLVPSIAPLGERTGTVDTHMCRVAYVCQTPSEQIVCDKVYAELAFGLENQCLKREDIISRIAEAAEFFGISDILYNDCATLSGGQKQIVNLASAVICQPDILVLDEPSSRLDPVSKEKLLTLIKKINDELGCCVIVCEHDISSLIPTADKMLLLDKGVIFFGACDDGLQALSEYPPLYDALPPSARIYSEFNVKCPVPMTVKDGRSYIKTNFKNDTHSLDTVCTPVSSEDAITVKNVYFRYERNGRDILKGATLNVKKGEVFCLLGGNGSGKSTLLSLIAGLNVPYSGEIKILNKRIKDYKSTLYSTLTMLSQDVQDLFTQSTVRAELELCSYASALPFDLSPILDHHPYDISGGQAQLLALAIAISRGQSILLLDEPTKGLDRSSVRCIANVINDLKEQGKTILCVTHDSEFACMCADRCSLLFSGECTKTSPALEFFSRNAFYTTAVSKMTRGIYDNIVTLEQCIEIMKKNGEKKL